MTVASTTPIFLNAGVIKRSTRLADGRELIYFDDANTTLGAERNIDERELDPRPANATMRQDVLTGDWISVAAARQNRAMLPPAELDPLAPQSPTNPSEVPSLYDVAVFENRSPSFGPALAVATGSAPAADNAPHATETLGFERTFDSVGRCEVIAFSPDRTGSFGTQSPERARTIIEAWADRTAALSALPGIEQVFVFENRGEAIGVTLPHPHGQIYAYPYITPRTQRLLSSIDQLGSDLFDQILTREQASERMVLAGEHWTAFVPFAARWPMEVHMMPHRHVADFTETNEAEREELSHLYLQLLRGIDAIYDSETPYIAAWHQAPVNAGRGSARLHLQLTSPRRAKDKMKFLAGSEAAMGAWVADIVPEHAALRIREAIARADAAHAAGIEGEIR